MNNINQKIPEGWSVKKLSDLCSKISDGIHTTPKYVDKSEYHFINGNNLRDGHIYIYEDTKCVSFEEYTKQKQELGTRTLLMSINGTIGSLANYCNEDVVLGKSAAFMNFNDMQTKKYVYTILQTNSTKRYFENELTGSTIKNLSLKSIKNMKLLLPPLPEQEKIAGILGTWDEAIEKLSSLIEQKKNLKKGLMQRLLTGKNHLKGFTQPWKEVKLGEICKFETAKSKSSVIDENGKYYIIDMGAVSTEGILISSKRTNLCEDLLKVNDIVMPKDDIGGGNIIGKTAIIKQEDAYILSDHVFKLKIHGSDAMFISYLINSFKYNKYMRRMSSGSAILGLAKKDIEKCMLYIPSDINEQQAIADVLSTVDKEIDILNKKLEALKEQKKGLMQQLLTGQTRVKVN